MGGRVDLSKQGKFRALFNGSLERWSLLDYGGYLSLVYDLWIHWYRFRAGISFDIFFLFFFHGYCSANFLKQLYYLNLFILHVACILLMNIDDVKF